MVSTRERACKEHARRRRRTGARRLTGASAGEGHASGSAGRGTQAPHSCQQAAASRQASSKKRVASKRQAQIANIQKILSLTGLIHPCGVLKGATRTAAGASSREERTWRRHSETQTFGVVTRLLSEQRTLRAASCRRLLLSRFVLRLARASLQPLLLALVHLTLACMFLIAHRTPPPPPAPPSLT